MQPYYTLRALFICTLALSLPANVLSAQGGDAGAGSFKKSGLAGKSMAESIYRGGVAGGDDSEVVSEAALPAELLAFGGEFVEGGVRIAWETDHEYDIEIFEVEYAADGVEFRPVSRRDPQGGRGRYAVRLPRPAGEQAYYRLRVVELDGSSWYSEVDHLLFSAGDWNFNLVTNPVVDGRPVFELRGLQAGESFTVRIANAQGQLIHSGFYRANGQGDPFSLPVRLQPASYYLTLEREDGSRQSRQLVVPR